MAKEPLKRLDGPGYIALFKFLHNRKNDLQNQTCEHIMHVVRRETGLEFGFKSLRDVCHEAGIHYKGERNGPASQYGAKAREYRNQGFRTGIQTALDVLESYHTMSNEDFTDYWGVSPQGKTITEILLFAKERGITGSKESVE